MADEFVGIGHQRCRRNILIGGIGASKSDVLTDRSLEQQRVLQHEAHLIAQRLQSVVADVFAINQNSAAGWIKKPGDEAHESGFAGTGRTDDGHRFPGADAKAYAR